MRTLLENMSTTEILMKFFRRVCVSDGFVRANLNDSLAILFLGAWFVVGSSSLLADSSQTSKPNRPWNEDVMYFAMLDRFCDGDPTNNQPAGSDPDLYDSSQNDISRYHGGDLRGLEMAIQDGYFERLGVTAIWTTPPVKNSWRSPFDLGGPKTGYHGYWTQNYLDIDPHWVSQKSLDGKPYSDDRDGRMQHYKDFVDLAHSKGIKVIQDVVCNHVGPLFYYDANQNQMLDFKDPVEWIAPFSDSPYTNTRWNNEATWNLVAPEPAGPDVVLGHRVNTSNLFRDFNVYGRRGYDPDSLGKSDGEEVVCDFFSLRDFATGPDTEHFDALVDQFVTIYHFYIDVIGVDGLRIDTVKHVHHEFWSEFTHRLRARLGPEASKLLLFGEVYDGNPRVLGKYTFSVGPSGDARDPEPCLDSLLNFEFCFNLRDYLRKPADQYGDAWGLRRTFRALNEDGDDAFYNQTAGADGLRPRQKMINFFENHDGLNRFLVREVDEQKQWLASVVLMTSEGIPCIYYGAEAGLRDSDGRLGQDAETGRKTFCRNGDVEILQQSMRSRSFQGIQRLAELRREHEALREGRIETLWADRDDTTGDEGLYVFARYVELEEGIDAAKTVIVAINANPKNTASFDKVKLVAGDDGSLPLVAIHSKLVARDLPNSTTVDGDQEPLVVQVDSEDRLPFVAMSVPPSSARIFVVDNGHE
jgi:alpha-amylase